MLSVAAPLVQALLDRVGPKGSRRVRDTLRRVVDERFGSGSIRLTNAGTVGRGTVGTGTVAS